MKIAIFGSYNGTSIGDTAILLGLLRGIYEATPDSEISILTTGPIDLSRDLDFMGLQCNPRTTRANVYAAAEFPIIRSFGWRLKRMGFRMSPPVNVKRCRKILADQDILIIGGGNLLMDLFKGGVEVLTLMTDAARSVNTPVVFAGVGAGPINLESSKTRLASCLEYASKVVVRDECSRQICVDLLGRSDTEVAADFAFSLTADNRLTPKRRALAVNVAAVGSPTWPVLNPVGYTNYLDGVVKLVSAAVDRLHPDFIDLVVTNPAVDLSASIDLAGLMQGSSFPPIRIRESRCVKDVIDAFSSADLAIVTRLHAAITASVAGCRILPVAYQAKVANVLTEQKVVDNVVWLEDLVMSEFDPVEAVSLALMGKGGVPDAARLSALEAVRSLLDSQLGLAGN